MDYDNPFAEEVRINPYDDVPRLIFADYLDDHGDPLGLFIRTQVTLTSLDLQDPQRTQLERQEQQLLETYGDQWLAPLRQLGAEGISARCFRRGLIERIRITAENFLAHGAALCLQCPALHTIAITNLRAVFPQFVVSPLPQQIRGLDLSLCRLDELEASYSAGNVPIAVEWPLMDCLTQLTELDLRFTKATSAAISQLCTRNLNNLRQLDLSACGIDPDGANALANCSSLCNLQSLKLNSNRLDARGVRFIAQSRALAELRVLDLASNRVTDEGAEVLANSATLVALEQINLRANEIMNRQFANLGSYRNMPHLKVVDLRNNPLR